MLMIEAKLSFMLVELFELFIVFAITHMGFSSMKQTNYCLAVFCIPRTHKEYDIRQVLFGKMNLNLPSVI